MMWEIVSCVLQATTVLEEEVKNQTDHVKQDGIVPEARAIEDLSVTIVLWVRVSVYVASSKY